MTVKKVFIGKLQDIWEFYPNGGPPVWEVTHSIFCVIILLKFWGELGVSLG